MRAFSAWLAMTFNDQPFRVAHNGKQLRRYQMFTEQATASRAGVDPAQRVLIIEDTEENRRKLGMEGA